MRLGVALHVSAGFSQAASIRDEPLAAGALQPVRSSGIPAVAGALLSGVFAGAGAAQRDGRIAADPAQPDRARGADRGSQGAGGVAAHRLDQAVSLRSDACQCRPRPRTRQTIWRCQRGSRLSLAPRGRAVLTRPVLVSDRAALGAPVTRGFRRTGGGEFARRDAPPTPLQVLRALPRAHALFPLGDPIEAKPWMGARPCLPDMLPVIGRAPRHAGLWVDFGHQHPGLTLEPPTGRLLAERRI